MSRKSVFISYSHKDEEWKNRVIVHLKVIESVCNINIWDDRKIEVGDDWLPEIEKQLNLASISILLISADFLSSNFIKRKEIPNILKRRAKEGLVVIPFILKPCSWQKIPWLKKIQLLPQDGRPLIKGNEYEIENDLSILSDVIHKNIFPVNPKKEAKIFKLNDFKNNSSSTQSLETKKTNKSSTPKKSKITVSPNGILQIAKGNKNVQIVGDIYHTSKPPNKIVLPPPNSIGSDTLLKQRIQTLFNKIGEEREKRFPGSGYSVLAKNFKSDFGIKNNKWTIIWTYPIECAQEITEYLESKYANTIQGRKENAWSKESYIPPRNIMYAKETELLLHLGLTTKSVEVKEMLNNFFGVQSHTKLSTNQHWQFVKYLENLIKLKYD
jgi:hypothetical protein